MSPHTTNVVKRPLILSLLHIDDNGPGHASVYSKLLGAPAGARFDEWMCKYYRWIVPVLVVSVISPAVWPSLPTSLARGISFLLASIPYALSINTCILKKLVRTAGVWYYVLSIVSGSVCYALIFGQRFRNANKSTDVARQFAEVFNVVAAALGLIVGLACGDSVPPRLLSARFRTALFACVSMWKNVVLLSGFEW